MVKNNVKKYRELRGLSQEKLSKESGVSRTTISRLENGTLNAITNTMMEKISVVLDVGVLELFFNKNVQ